MWITMSTIFVAAVVVACVLFRARRIGFWSFVLIPLISVFAAALVMAILILLSGDM